MRRLRGIPYMNEFRSVKQRDRRLELPDFMLQSPHAPGSDVCATAPFTLRSADALPRGLRLCNSGPRRPASLFIWENFRCDVIYLRSLLLPDIH
jgi:hypothetical protein